MAVQKIQLGIVLEPITEKSPNPSFSQTIPAGSHTTVKRIAPTISGKSSKKRKDPQITAVGKIVQIKDAQILGFRAVLASSTDI